MTYNYNVHKIYAVKIGNGNACSLFNYLLNPRIFLTPVQQLTNNRQDSKGLKLKQF